MLCFFSMDHGLDALYWQRRYEKEKTGWDLGHLSAPLKYIIDSLDDKSLRILVPGGGNAFEVEYLWRKGFKNVSLLDWAQAPLQNFAKRNPDFPQSQILEINFFDLDDMFDLVLEQTFFCSLHPAQRHAYVLKMSEILHDSGRLRGVLFNVPLYDDRPPFGGNSELYKRLFESYFEIRKMSLCETSEAERKGMELEIDLEKP